MATSPVGPAWVGGFEQFVVNDQTGEQYTILYLPDFNNYNLQLEGKPPHYYWVPASVRLARFGDVGDFKFRHIHFVGAFDPNLHVGVEGKAEVVGGLLSFTTTYRYPTAVLMQAEQELLAKFRGKSDRYWGWRTQAAPMFSICPINSSNTVVTNLSPGRGGTAPVESIPVGGTPVSGGGTPVGGGGTPVGGGGTPVPAGSETRTSSVDGTPTFGSNGASALDPGASSASKSLVRRADLTQKVVHGRAPNITNLDAWAFELQGQGPGSITGGENAFSGLMGALPSELIWAGFQGGSSPLVVTQNLTLPLWSQVLSLKITGNWDRIFQHFSGHVNANYLWFAADIKAEFNQLRIKGDIVVELTIDGTVPGADKREEEINKRIDAITKIFTDEASRRIFEPPPPTVEPAAAPSGGFLSRFFGGSAGLALKYRRDETKLNLSYNESRSIRYNHPTTISSSFESFYNIFKKDPNALKKYFTRLIMGDLNAKVARIVKPVVNWPDPAKNWVGEPVSFLSAEIGYPSSKGSLQWNMRVFQKTDTTDQSNWNPVFAKREEEEVQNPPIGWKPDVTYIRRRIHLTEPMGMTDNDYVKVQVEKNVIDLDPVGGTASTDNIIEVRADSAGTLECGPIDIDVMLQDASQVVTVEFKAEGKRHDGTERPIVKFQWRSTDLNQPRYWEIFTGQLDFVPKYQYRVSVTVKGSLFSAGMSWTGNWEDGQGNGALMVRVPRADEPGVTSRRLTPREIALDFPDAEQSIGSTPEEVVGTSFNGQPPSDSSETLPVGGNGHLEHSIPPPQVKTAGTEYADRIIAGYGIGEPSTGTPPGENRLITSEEGNGNDNINAKKANVDPGELKLLTGEQAWVEV